MVSRSSSPPSGRAGWSRAREGRHVSQRANHTLGTDHHRTGRRPAHGAGSDPADWLATHGPAGLYDLLSDPARTREPDVPRTVVPSRELIQVLLDRADDPTCDAVQIVTGLAAHLAPTERTQLLRESAAEMTRHGRNPRDAYTKALERAMHQGAAAASPAPRAVVSPSLSIQGVITHMSPMTLLETAAAELQAAADLADQHADGNPLDPWSAMAGTIRLVASGLDPFGGRRIVAQASLRGHLASAIAALDRLPARDASSDS